MKQFIIKAIIFITIIISVVFITDKMGLFNPDNSDNHVIKKWNYFYRYTESTDFDVILYGNSRVYTGINPHNLCNILGINSFILASPGTSISETYFSLRESLYRTRPKLVIIETSTLNNNETHKLKGQALSDLLKSFSARKNFVEKIKATPDLFSIDNYPMAWSNTIRNHQFLLSDFQQVSANIDIYSNGPKKINYYPLYLGRYIISTTGISDSILLKYQTVGAPVDGEKFTINDESKMYLAKIKRLCDDNNIQLAFLTLPVYNKHIKNYPAYRNTLAKAIEATGKPWLNLQEPENYIGFTDKSFENSYKANQHMTYRGSLTATYKLAEFINQTYPKLLTNRKNDEDWIYAFYGDEGYFENNPILKDQINSILAKNVKIDSIDVVEADYIKQNEVFSIKIKTKKGNIPYEKLKQLDLSASVEVKFKAGDKQIELAIPLDTLHTPKDFYLYQMDMKRLNITKINKLKLIKKKPLPAYLNKMDSLR